jgi:hypothetical protein
MSLPVIEGRRFGRLYDKYDRRDLKMASAPVFVIPLAQLPPVGDLREWMGPIKDQGDEGSCTGHAYSSDGEWSARKYLTKSPIFSPQFTYAEELIIEGSFANDDGASPRTGCIVSVKYGYCESSVFPYVAGQITKPTPVQEANALTWRFKGAYHRIDTAAQAVACCADKVPWLFTVGFNVFKSFVDSNIGTTGIMPIPDTNKEALLGGHEVLGGLAWDIGDTPKLRPAGCPKAILIQNSWGKSWGINGCFWMPIEVLDNPDIVSDIWMLHNGGPWVPKQ